MSEFLQRIIPSGNRLEVAFAHGVNGDKAELLETLYSAGFVGAFPTSHGSEEAGANDWRFRAGNYLRDEFHAEGGQKLSDVWWSVVDEPGDGECHQNHVHSLELWQLNNSEGPEPFDTAQDYGSCFPPGVMIRMADGTSKPIEQVKLLDTVATAEGNTGCVLSLMARHVSEPIYRVKLWGHYGLTLTGEHPILTSRGYVKAKDIAIGDEVAISRYVPQQQQQVNVIQTELHAERMRSSWSRNYRRVSTKRVYGKGGVQRTIRVCNPVPDMIQMSPDFGRLLGLYLAEGNVDSGKTVWTFNAAEEYTLVAETVTLIKSLFGIEASVSNPGRGTIKVSLHSTPFAQVFSSLCGAGSATKRLHADVTLGPPEFRKAVLMGWLAGDGYDRGLNVLQGTTVSKQLALDMMSIASGCGLRPTIRRSEPKASHGVRSRQPRYDVYILKNLDLEGSWQSRHDDTGSWRKVRSIEQLEYSGYVFNCSVQGDQSYVADELGVHNCVDASLSELCTAILGLRIKWGKLERWVRPVAWYPYSLRGYCSDGWNAWGAASALKKLGVAFRQRYNLDGNTIDLTDDDVNEQLMARTWCRSGPPDWLRKHTLANHPIDATKVVEFDGGLQELKTAFANGGVLHFSGTRVSGGSKPFTPGTTGPHQMPAYGYDDSEEGRKWFKDKCGITLTADDFAVHCGNTWGTNWRGECADIYWPPHWGPKTSGSWICSAKWMLANLSLDMVYFPDAFPGIPGDPLPPQPTDPKWEGAVYAEQMPSGLIAIRGEVVCDGKAAIIVPDGAGRYRPVPKPVL